MTREAGPSGTGTGTGTSRTRTGAGTGQGPPTGTGTGTGTGPWGPSAGTTSTRAGGEDPADLRLLLPALAAWAAAALCLVAPGAWTATGVVGCLLVALVLLRAARGEGGRWRTGRVAVSAVLLCAAAGAASAGLHGADVRRGPVPALARAHADVEAEVTVTADPVRTRAQVRGSRSMPALLLIDAEIIRLARPARGPGPGRLPSAGHRLTSGTGPASWEGAYRLRTPVVLMVSPGAGPQAWQSLLPTTRLRIAGRLVPPTREGERSAASLRVEARAAPQILTGPTFAQRTAGKLREGLRRATDTLGPDARALLPGLVLGDTSRVPTELHDAFRATDLSHLLSVSGANLSVLLFLLIGAPSAALSAERKGLAPRLGLTLRMTALTGGLITLAFVLVCRPEPSVLRAAACGLITLLAIGTGRRRALIPALAAAVLLLVLYDPWLARSYGFLLSVLATGALLTLAPRWGAALSRRGVPPRLAEVLAAAAAAQAVCAPVVVVLASRVSLVAVPCNLLAEFAVAPATVLGFAVLAVAPVSMPAAQVLARVAGWPVGWIAGVARTGAGLPGAETAWPGGWGGAGLLAGATVLVVLGVRRWGRHPWVCAAAALLLVLAVVRPVPLTRMVTGWPPPGWAFALCDVGQGDAMVLAAGDGAGVVVDAGPEPAPVDRCLRELGVSRVPLLVLTHFHADHVRGLPGVLRGRAVGAIQTTGLEQPPEQAAFVRRTATAAGVPVIPAVAGEHRRIGALDWRVLWPGAAGTALPAVGTALPRPLAGAPATPSVPEEPNDASVTLLVTARGGLRLLLLGDLEPLAQGGLIRAHPGLSPVDVLKVAHHGSGFQDPRLLDRVRPRLALISCGAENPYGHPAPRTVAALRAGGATVMRTDLEGAIAVSGAGSGLRVTGRR
ncbi:ComEC/Rec2 family competence protein [Streptomyces sp. AM 2-1-1]|uniref:ComEC/Rec2 family competence protein n=1 Tax=Streptomyces sp. AM 2-1-1 TaxID=3028709 RepID=UPI0023B97C07|nr:ComEC/Rec2 family competence protein [Streptomyces sp. AM 2-1-1]WEH41857.1 ComEC/Rec2 family competence protein [Streptomyces sp. AM 2-1-1]